MDVRQGIDLVDVRRMQATLRRRGKAFCDRVFTRREQAYCESKRMKYEHYAARFAAKEAAMKTFDLRRGNRFHFREIEIRRRPTGKPFIYLSAASRKRFGVPEKCRMELSMAHERELAVAIVLLWIP